MRQLTSQEIADALNGLMSDYEAADILGDAYREVLALLQLAAKWSDEVWQEHPNESLVAGASGYFREKLVAWRRARKVRAV